MSNSIIDELAAGITQFENSGSNPNTAGNLNPGNMVYSTTSSPETSNGATAGTNGFAAFPSAASGLAALKGRLTQIVNGGATLTQLVKTWAGSQYVGNSPQSQSNYTSFLASKTGLDPNTPISSQSNGTLPVPVNTTVGSSAASTSPKDESEDQSDLSDFFQPHIIIAAIIGVICLAGGIAMLATGKSPSQIVVSGTRAGVKGAKAVL